MLDLKIQEKVEEHYDFVCTQYPKEQILGVFLYGSQNYNLHTENSDVDTKAIYIPTFSELVFDKPISKELHLPNGEHCEVKDIREMVRNFKKQNINFIEILFTDYFVLNPKYAELWTNNFILPREAIARYDPQQAVHAAAYQALHTLKQAMNGEDTSKKMANVIRLLYFIERYVRGEEYISCLIPIEEAHDMILRVKTNLYLTDCYSFANNILKISLEGYACGNYRPFVNIKIQEKVNKVLDNAILEILKLNF